MELNYLLSARGIDTTKKKVLVMRHTPQEPELRKALPWLAAERPEVFNAYQQTQQPKVEKMLKGADYLVSCIGFRGKPTEALFIGVYKVDGYKLRSRDELLNSSAELTLQELAFRLTQTPTRCRVRPRAGVKVGIGRRLNAARDAEQRAERVERVEAPVEAEGELIEVGL